MPTERYFRPWRFILPGVVLGLVTLGYPIARAVYLAFHSLRMRRMDQERFVGFENFVDLFSDPLFFRSITSTVLFTLGTTLLAIGFGLLISSVMSTRGIRGTGKARLFMAFFLVPFVTTQIVTAILGRLFIWQSTFGLVNFLLEAIGLKAVPWLISTDYALIATIITNAWRMTPLALLIFYAALVTIPDELVESAEVDGASWYSMWFRIKFPMIKFHIGFVSLVILTSAFREFDTIYGLTGGGPGRVTEVLSILVYREGVAQGDLGMANAISLVMLLIVAGLTLLAVKGLRLGNMRE